MVENKTKLFLDKKNIFAVVGVSRDENKYGRKVYDYLKNLEYTVYPINPAIDSIGGDKCYSKLEDLPVASDVVSFVVPPKITEDVLLDCKRLGIDKVWFQPGSESKKAIDFCTENDIKEIHGLCILMEAI